MNHDKEGCCIGVLIIFFLLTLLGLDLELFGHFKETNPNIWDVLRISNILFVLGNWVSESRWVPPKAPQVKVFYFYICSFTKIMQTPFLCLASTPRVLRNPLTLLYQLWFGLDLIQRWMSLKSMYTSSIRSIHSSI